MTEMLTSYDPRTGLPVGGVAITPPEEVPAVVERSRKAFSEWKLLSHQERRTLLKRFKQVVLEEGEHIAEVVRSETGKPLPEAYSIDVLTGLTVMDYYIRNAEQLLRPRRGGSWPFVTTKGWTEYHPRGVAGVIAPWNYPFFLAMIPTITALSAGCSVVLKPSEITPLTGQLFATLADRAGLPSDLVQVIHGDGVTGAALAESAVDVLAFTGSTRVGKQVAAEAAKRLTPVILELGGNDAMVVLEDADLKQTARAALWAGMLNAGQACIAVERLYVVDSIYDEFLTNLDKAFDLVAVATEDERDIGPIINPPQLDIIEAHVQDAVDKGARVLRGGKRALTETGIYFEPTLLVDVDHSMTIVQKETFGPVLPVIRVANESEALRLANDTRFGLHGSVWSKDRGRAKRFASQMKSGTVAVNDVAVNFIVPTVSFGGIGDSGYGSNFGQDGIRTTFCYPKSITAARLPQATSKLLGSWQPRRGLRYWKTLAKILFRW
ncbi:MAG: aldehyde dehydrogenase family protein [Acidimicrobiia bacterium]|nr:aldehyde dehydrogenase family protein [Acidimicrobiia bacterium]MDH3398296.1 aldehyde dehydrogenase family protein [Acidimicrobiia bacterium]